MSSSLVSHHVPVMLNEVLAQLQPLAGKTIVDGTLGGGGYTRALLDDGATRVIAFDRDPQAITRAQMWQGEYGEKLQLVEAPFATLQQHVNGEVDAVVLDLGLSSDQLDDEARGFAYREDGALDMRMGDTGETAADVLNSYREEQIADILYAYGEERRSRAIAKRVVARRKDKKFATTKDLMEVIEQVYPARGQVRRHPAVRSFQALRIHVNGEMAQLEEVLPQAADALKVGGRVVVVTFHSLEDRVVKHFFKACAQEGLKTKSFTLPHKKPLVPSAAEVEINPRARSAKLRTMERSA